MASPLHVHLQISPQQKVYFASDFHLGLPTRLAPIERERIVVEWLETIEKDASAVFFVGDIFDFWYEWKYAVPKGYIRFLGQLARMVDKGIQLHFFTGNHDIWLYGYLQQELKAQIYRQPISLQINNTLLYVAHGDGLGPKDYGFKFLKKIFTNKLAQWAFGWLHPTIALWFGYTWSQKRRYSQVKKEFLGEKEWLIIHSREIINQQPFKYLVYGHRHIPVVYPLNQHSVYINLGDWISNFTYGIFSENQMHMHAFKQLPHVVEDGKKVANTSTKHK